MIRIEKITGIRPEFEQIDLTEGEQVRDFFRRHQDIKAVIHFFLTFVLIPRYDQNLFQLLNNQKK